MNQISIFILGHQPITREGLRSLLRLGSNLNVTGEAETLPGALACVGRMRVNVVLIDLPLPICAVDATRQILSADPAAHVVVLSRYAEDPEVASVIAAELRKAGASALLPKNTPARDLVGAIQRVSTGDSVFPPQISGTSEITAILGEAHEVAQPSLTLRQTQVLKLVAEGLANKEIADRLSISPKTVEKHRQSVKAKLHTNNAADLARRAIGLGLVQAA